MSAGRSFGQIWQEREQKDLEASIEIDTAEVAMTATKTTLIEEAAAPDERIKIAAEVMGNV